MRPILPESKDGEKGIMYCDERVRIATTFFSQLAETILNAQAILSSLDPSIVSAIHTGAISVASIKNWIHDYALSVAGVKFALSFARNYSPSFDSNIQIVLQNAINQAVRQINETHAQCLLDNLSIEPPDSVSSDRVVK